MTTYPRSANTSKAGIVLVDPETGVVRTIIMLQYNSADLGRTLQFQDAGGDGGDRSEALRLTGPPVETIKLKAEVDATDQIDLPGEAALAAKYGVMPKLAALERIAYPPSGALLRNNAMAEAGMLEIIPMEAPLTLFVWGKHRILPVRLASYSASEEGFDPGLVTLRASVDLEMRVLSVDDLGFDHLGGGLYMNHHGRIELMALRHRPGTLGGLGIADLGIETE